MMSTSGYIEKSVTRKILLWHWSAGKAQIEGNCGGRGVLDTVRLYGISHRKNCQNRQINFLEEAVARKNRNHLWYRFL